MDFHVGDEVVIRGKYEILQTLDKNGTLDGLPFMPQMFKYCGEKHTVFKRAHKTCDTVNRTGGRKVLDCVHLDLRCDGESHGNCHASCLIFWKTAWLESLNRNIRTDQTNVESLTRKNAVNSVDVDYCTESDIDFASKKIDYTKTEIQYICQATQLPRFTSPLPWWDVRQYFEDYFSGNVTFRSLLNGFIYACFYNTYHHLRNIHGSYTLLRIFDKFQNRRKGSPYPRWGGAIPMGSSTPTCTLDLEPGELVQVKTYNEILETLDTNNKNRGLYFDAEMVPFCGRVFKVKKRVATFIDEKSGKIITMKTPAIILENVYCQARYSDCRMFCPRSIYSWWREIWLKRV